MAALIYDEDDFVDYFGGMQDLLTSAASAGFETVLWHFARNMPAEEVNNPISVDGSTMLHIFAKSGHTELCRFLIEKKGASLDVTDGLFNTPLHLAVKAGAFRVVELLVKNGARVDMLTEECTPLYWAAMMGRADIVDVLLTKSTAEMNVPTSQQNSQQFVPLHIAAFNGYKDVVLSLLNKKADVNVLDKDGNTPLHHAALYGHYDVAKILIDHGANASKENNDKNTPLHCAVLSDDDKIAKLIVEKIGKQNINVLNNDLHSPLYLAAVKEKENVLFFLLSLNENFSFPERVRLPNGQIGSELLHWAAKCSPLFVVKIMVEGGADATAKNRRLETPLHWAVEGKRLANAKFLMSLKNVDVNARNSVGETPLQSAVIMRDSKMVELLLKNGVGIDANTTFGPAKATPLHFAAALGNVDMVEVLLQNVTNIDVNARCASGGTPLHTAIASDIGITGISVSEEQRLKVVKCLIEHGASITIEDRRRRTPLQRAQVAQPGNAIISFLEKIAQQGANLGKENHTERLRE